MNEQEAGAGLINGTEISAEEMIQLNAIVESSGGDIFFIKGSYIDAVTMRLNGKGSEAIFTFVDDGISNPSISQAIVNLAQQYSHRYEKNNSKPF